MGGVGTVSTISSGLKRGSDFRPRKDMVIFLGMLDCFAGDWSGVEIGDSGELENVTFFSSLSLSLTGSMTSGCGPPTVDAAD